VLYIKAGAANMVGAWFIHQSVWPVRGLYRPDSTGIVWLDNGTKIPRVQLAYSLSFLIPRSYKNSNCFGVKLFWRYDTIRRFRWTVNLGDSVELTNVRSRKVMSEMLSNCSETRMNHFSSAPHNLRLTTCGFFNQTITALINCSAVDLTDSTWATSSHNMSVKLHAWYTYQQTLINTIII